MGEENGVGNLFGGAALEQDDDQIDLPDGQEAVGADEGGPAAPQAAQGLLEQAVAKRGPDNARFLALSWTTRRSCQAWIGPGWA